MAKETKTNLDFGVIKTRSFVEPYRIKFLDVVEFQTILI